jgi:hypothetical protein
MIIQRWMNFAQDVPRIITQLISRELRNQFIRTPPMEKIRDHFSPPRPFHVTQHRLEHIVSGVPIRARPELVINVRMTQPVVNFFDRVHGLIVYSPLSQFLD